MCMSGLILPTILFWISCLSWCIGYSQISYVSLTGLYCFSATLENMEYKIWIVNNTTQYELVLSTFELESRVLCQLLFADTLLCYFYQLTLFRLSSLIKVGSIWQLGTVEGELCSLREQMAEMWVLFGAYLFYYVLHQHVGVHMICEVLTPVLT